jgi:hypothetical protein
VFFVQLCSQLDELFFFKSLERGFEIHIGVLLNHDAKSVEQTSYAYKNNASLASRNHIFK